nr:GGDEF domain-containing protein [Anaerovorax odorimutans]
MLDQIHRDSFSGLYNKIATQEQIDGLLRETPGSPYGFFILDIDDFKTINDRYGHQIGDLAIAEFASVLKEQFREEDIVGRIGGDEFVAFIPLSSLQQAETRAKELLRAIHHKNFEMTHVYRLSVSMGIAVAPQDGTDFKTLYRHADRALYQTKEQGKNGYTIYGDSLKVRRF